MDELLLQWKKVEAEAAIRGWDFSPIADKLWEGELAWDYADMVRGCLRPELSLLDVDTGGGEFLLSLGHPYERTAASEFYGSNVELCRARLLPLGIDFRPGPVSALPFADGRFDLCLDRHGDLCPQEFHRILKKGGIFLTQQVGAGNDRELVRLLLGNLPEPFPEQTLERQTIAFEKAGFRVLDGAACRSPIRFYSVEALIWFARVIPWEFVGFSVEKFFENLFKAKTIIETTGYVEGTRQRFWLKAEKV